MPVSLFNQKLAGASYIFELIRIVCFAILEEIQSHNLMNSLEIRCDYFEEINEKPTVC